jgi:hypothetical protein
MDKYRIWIYECIEDILKRFPYIMNYCVTHLYYIFWSCATCFHLVYIVYKIIYYAILRNWYITFGIYMNKLCIFDVYWFGFTLMYMLIYIFIKISYFIYFFSNLVRQSILIQNRYDLQLVSISGPILKNFAT